MKVNLDDYKLEDGTIDTDKLNADIQKETAKSFNEGSKRAKSETEQEYAQKLEKERLAKLTETQLIEERKNKEVEEMKKALDELNNKLTTQTNEQIINTFKKEAKGKLTEAQIEDLIPRTKVEALSDFNFDLYKKKTVEDIGDDNLEQDVTTEEEKKSLLAKIRAER